MVITGVKDQKITDEYCLYCGDCCDVLPALESESIGFSVFSPPFASLYSYTDEDADMGNSRSPKEFFEHFSFLIPELFRLLMPGRVVAVHCMDLPVFKRDEEEIGIYDFPGDLVRAFRKQGFVFHSRFCIWKDPLIAAVRTRAIGLAHKQLVKDSSVCRTGIADYILAFRKPGQNPKPIRNENSLSEYYGLREIPRELNRYVGWGDPKTNKRAHWIWQQYASPVWFDIDQTNVLPYKKAREGDDEKHICPLQIQVIERCIALWSAKDDVVLTPFMGVGSEVYVAVKNGRKGIGVELKRSYFKQAVRNLESLKYKQQVQKGFDL